MSETVQFNPPQFIPPRWSCCCFFVNWSAFSWRYFVFPLIKLFFLYYKFPNTLWLQFLQPGSFNFQV